MLTATTFAGPIPIKSGDKVNILFVGNSLTGAKAGGLGGYVENFFKQNGYTDAMTGSISVCPKKSLRWALTHKNDDSLYVKDMINDGNEHGKFDIVVLQDYSDDLADNPDNFYDSVKTFSKLIRDNGGIPVLFMRWPNAPKDANTMALYTRETKLLQERYDAIGAEINAPVVPIALIWQTLMQNPAPGKSSKFLYKTDNVHQTEYGKYANVFAFFSMFTQSSPVGKSFSYPTGASGIPEASVQRYLQEVVWEVIGSREDWASSSNFLTLSPTALSFEATGGTEQVSISTDLTGLSATPSADWLSATLSNKTLSITAQANTTASERQGSVTVTAGNKSKTISITQARQLACDFAISKELILFDWYAAVETVLVTTDEPWSATADSSWLHLIQSGDTLFIDVEENPVCGRLASVTIIGCDQLALPISQNYKNSGSECVLEKPGETFYHEAELFTDTLGYKSVKDWGSAGSSGEYHMSSDGPNSRVSWTVSVTTAGNYKVALRTMNGSTSARSGSILINGSAPVALEFAPNGVGWSATGWDTTEVAGTFALTAGDNVIELTTTARGPYVDWLSFTALQSTAVQPVAHSPKASGAQLSVRLISGQLVIDGATHIVQGALYNAAGIKVADIRPSGASPQACITLRSNNQRLAAGMYLFKAQTLTGQVVIPLINNR